VLWQRSARAIFSYLTLRQFVYYVLADDGILDVLTALRRIAERNMFEVERDVRPPDEFELGHLPGAINIPLHALKTRLAELDTAREIVAYCRGEYCVLSFEAVALLRARGFNVRRLEDGLPEWRAAKLPVVTGSA
jgi:rhodanese-related sulfurtransferase